MAEVFVPGKAYEWQIALDIANIEASTLIHLLRSDARALGILAEHIVAEHFSNLKTGGGAILSYDIIEDPVGGGLRSWDCKTASKGKAANLEASHMKGTGRKFDKVKHEARREGLYGYIVCDVSLLPWFRLIGLPMTECNKHGFNKRVPRKKLDRLLRRDLITLSEAGQ